MIKNIFYLNILILMDDNSSPDDQNLVHTCICPDIFAAHAECVFLANQWPWRWPCNPPRFRP